MNSRKSLITDPRSSLTETKSSRKEKFLALYYRKTKIRMRSDERDE